MWYNLYVLRTLNRYNAVVGSGVLLFLAIRVDVLHQGTVAHFLQ